MPTDEIVFDSGQYIPYGLQGATTLEADEDDPVLDSDQDNNELFGDEDVEGELLEEDYEQSDESDEVDDGVGVPQNMTIVSQTFRTAPDGRQVVDVVIEVDNIDDAVRYEVRTS